MAPSVRAGAATLRGRGLRTDAVRTGEDLCDRQRAWCGFSVESKVVVLIAVSVAMSFMEQTLFSVALVAALLGYIAVGGQRSLAGKLALSYGALFCLYSAMAYFDVRLIIFAPIHIFMAWKAYPVLVATAALVTAPPGMMSAFLTRLRLPKKLIVGVLVIVRFFPTTRTGIRKLRESLKNRGLTSLSQVARNPLDTLEYLLVPLMMALVMSADQLSASAITRAAEAPTQRSSYYSARQRGADYLCQGIALVGCMAMVVLT